MSKRITKIKQTCWACPSAWEGKTDNDEDVYIKYRYGVLSLTVDDILVEKLFVGDGLDGVMDLDKAIEALSSHITISEEAYKNYKPILKEEDIFTEYKDPSNPWK